MNNSTNVVYVENKTQPMGPIGFGMVCDEHQTRQQRDRSYRFGLRQKRY